MLNAVLNLFKAKNNNIIDVKWYYSDIFANNFEQNQVQHLAN